MSARFQRCPEEILGSRSVEGSKREYLVKWKGLTKEFSTWKSEESLENVSDMLQLYEYEKRAESEYIEELTEIDTSEKLSWRGLTKHPQIAKEEYAHTEPALEQRIPRAQTTSKEKLVKINTTRNMQDQQAKRTTQSRFFRPTRQPATKPPLPVEIDYLCQKNGEQLYSVKAESTPTILMTSSELRVRYPKQLIAFYEREIVRRRHIAPPS